MTSQHHNQNTAVNNDYYSYMYHICSVKLPPQGNFLCLISESLHKISFLYLLEHAGSIHYRSERHRYWHWHKLLAGGDTTGICWWQQI